MKTKNNFINSLRIPIFRQQIFQYLPLKTILRLRIVSRDMKFIIAHYLSELRIMNMVAWLPERVCGIKFKNGLNLLLAQTHSLRILNLSNCPWLTDDILISVLRLNPYLTELNISGCIHLSAIGFYLIIRYGRNVKALNIINCTFKLHSFYKLNNFVFEKLELTVNNNSIKYLVQLLRECTNLRSLTLKIDKSIIEEDVIVEALGHCKDLKILLLHNGTDEVLRGFSYLAACKNIQYLNLTECIQMTDNSLKALQNFKNLKDLHLDGCSSVMLEGIRYLTVCENMQALIVMNSDWLNVKDDVLEILPHFRDLRTLRLFD